MGRGGGRGVVAGGRRRGGGGAALAGETGERADDLGGGGGGAFARADFKLEGELVLGGIAGTALEAGFTGEPVRGGTGGDGRDGEEAGLAARTGGGALRGGGGAVVGFGAFAVVVFCLAGNEGVARTGAGAVGLAALGTTGGRARLGAFANVSDAAGFSFGIPPAKRPPSCGGPPLEGSLIEGDAPNGALIPPPPPPPPPPFGPSTTGALRSLVSAFFSLLPA